MTLSYSMLTQTVALEMTPAELKECRDIIVDRFRDMVKALRQDLKDTEKRLDDLITIKE